MSNADFDMQGLDRDLSLGELLNVIETGRLQQVLNQLFDDHAYALSDDSGKVLMGVKMPAEAPSLPLVIEIETIGQLQYCEEDEPAAKAAHQIVLMLLKSGHRYLMASTMHIQTVQEDYAMLQQKHEALQQSEQQYRELCEQLDHKVQQQVKQLEVTQRKLFASEKMASVGQLAAGIAHEINNPSGFIQSNLKTAQSYLDDLNTLGEKVKSKSSLDDINTFWREKELDFVLDDFSDLMSESIDGIHRISQIVADLKVFANIDSEEQLTVNINRYITASCNMAETSLPASIVLKFEAGEIPDCPCRPAYLGQVVLALIMNAANAIRDAGRESGVIEIRSYILDNKVCVDVVDDGCGIPEEFAGRVFDPFFTTRAVGKGKGLGLTYCKDIIEAHRGEIEISSTAGSGTRVTFRIPSAAPEK